MSEKSQNENVREYAGGWITERKGTDVPVFLKVAFILIAGRVDHHLRDNPHGVCLSQIS